jgi:hypothetical protein
MTFPSPVGMSLTKLSLGGNNSNLFYGVHFKGIIAWPGIKKLVLILYSNNIFYTHLLFMVFNSILHT